jgi:hypothetical protein
MPILAGKPAKLAGKLLIFAENWLFLSSRLYLSSFRREKLVASVVFPHLSVKSAISLLSTGKETGIVRIFTIF